MLFQTNMEKLKLFFSNPRNKRILLVILVIFAIVIPYMLGKVITGKQRHSPLTIPIIPTATITPTGPIVPLDTSNPHNPTQRLIFNWGITTADFPDSIPDYTSTTPLVNPNAITSIANKLGYTALQQSPYVDGTFYLWGNESTSLFGSPSQNQILFSTTSPLPATTTIIPKEQALILTKSLLSGLLGESIVSTFDTNPEVQYLSFNPQGADEEPAKATPETANLININYHQLVDGRPILSLSPKGETVSVAMDTSKKLYRLNIYGGYQSLNKKGDMNVPSLSRLIEIAPTSAKRISYAENIEAEAAFTNSTVLNISVVSAEVGYFHREDQTLFPVFIIRGNMSARNLTSYPAIYIVPITPSQSE